MGAKPFQSGPRRGCKAQFREPGSRAGRPLRGCNGDHADTSRRGQDNNDGRFDSRSWTHWPEGHVCHPAAFNGSDFWYQRRRRRRWIQSSFAHGGIQSPLNGRPSCGRRGPQSRCCGNRQSALSRVSMVRLLLRETRTDKIGYRPVCGALETGR